jgi:hypothetical protein
VNAQDNQFPAQTRDALEKCLVQIRLLRAIELAQSRRFLESERLMSPNGELPDDPRELDLLARIAAKQEQFAKARRLWETALQKSPVNVEYSQCLERVRKLERASGLIDSVLNYVVWVVVVFSIAAIVYAFKPLK